MSSRKFEPVRGEHVVAQDERHTIAASEAFDRAWRHALEQAREQWGAPAEVDVDVHLHAQIHLWNPGGIGICTVTLAPQ